MMADALAWIATEVGLPMLEDDPKAGVRANPAAQALLPSLGRDLTAAAAALTKCSTRDPVLLDLVARARAGVRGAGTLGRWRVLAAPEQADTARLLFVPARLEQNASTERRAASADLAGGVAHELGNAMGAILGWTELARAEGGLPPRAHRALDRIDASARSAQAQSRHMLDTLRGTQEAVAPHDVADVVREVVNLLEPVAEERGVHLRAELFDAFAPAPDRAPLFTIAWNLVQNAIEASPEGGTVTASVWVELGRVRLAVEDEGPGVPEAVKGRLFEPYFTTKAQGTGLGLALVRQAVDALGGELQLGDDGGSGSVFHVTLPEAKLAETGGPQPGVADHRRSGVRPRGVPGRSRILVVDDDRSMRELIATTLELQGAEVVAVAGQMEAESLEGHFDLALVDFALEGTRGDELVARLRRKGIIQVAALVSGASSPGDLHPEGAPQAWLRKPFELEDLSSLVQRLLARPSSTATAQGS